MSQLSRRHRKIAPYKLKMAGEILENVKKYKTFLVLDLTGVPAKHIQMLRKRLNNIAVMKVVKPKVALKAFETASLPVDKLEPYMTGQVMLVFTDMNVFEIADIVQKFTTHDYYGPGEAVDKEIMIPEGNTGIPAGPMLSIFGKLKIPTKVQGNVIHVAKDTIVAKPGDIISPELASLLQKLGLALKEIRVKVKCGYDNGLVIPGEKLVLNISEYEEALKSAAVDGLKLAIELVIPEPIVLTYVLSRAHRQAIALATEAGFITPETAQHILMMAHMRAVVLAAELAKYIPELAKEVAITTSTTQVSAKTPTEESKKEEKKKEEETEKLSEESLAEGFAALFG